MKKIVGVILAAGLLTGIATAADIGFSYKGSNYFTSNSENLNYEGSLRKDCLSVSLTTEAAGIVIDYDTDGGKLAHDEYYGWLNFGLPAGSLQVTAGVWKGRYVNRIRADQGDLDSEDFELFKPGVINGTAGADSDNLTGGNLGLVAAWTLADKLPGALIVKLGLFKNGTWNPESSDTGNEEDLKVTAGFTGEVAYRQDGLFNVNFAMRSLTKSNWVFGLWFSPLMAEKLQLTVGGTVATVNSYKKDDSWGANRTEWGVDLRARYKVTDALSLTTMNNISSGTNTGISNDDKNELVLWDMLNMTYAFADNLKAGLTLQSIRGGLDDDHESQWDVMVSPSLAIQATERAAVTTSVRATLADIHNWAITSVKLTIPVIFSYNY
ncbi:MAG: hypothetical protein K2M90_08445 [Treponemataceae bacterium]|nr:hypothetical protein [Treponemataceae bacterium]MDE7392469.1 hypothetical protein [Treponemataceae bacterium]